MSFTNSSYDECQAQNALIRSVNPGEYQLQTPSTNCNPCFTPDPHIRIQKNGVATCTSEITDLDSQMMGLTNKSTNCQHGNPNAPSSQCKPTMPEDCPQMKTNHSRMTNPPCELRGVGVNRWEWLHCNPQDYAIRPFRTQTNSRQVAKDNYRPCIKEPWEEANPPAAEPECASNIDAQVGVPIGSGQSILNDGLLPEQGNTNPQQVAPMTHWRSCQEIQQY